MSGKATLFKKKMSSEAAPLFKKEISRLYCLEKKSPFFYEKCRGNINGSSSATIKNKSQKRISFSSPRPRQPSICRIGG
jgi:hypothetical protein